MRGSADVVGDAEGAGLHDASRGEVDEDHGAGAGDGLVDERAAVVAQFVRERLRAAKPEIIAPLPVAIGHAADVPAKRGGVAGERQARRERAHGVETAVRLVLDAVVVSVREMTPRVLTLAGERPSLPSGDFRPDDDRTLELAARRLIAEQTGLRVGYLEQLYTFGDRFRDPAETRGGPRLVSVGYLALVGGAAADEGERAAWSDWYRFFPWEDGRGPCPARAEVVRFVGDHVDAAHDRATYERARIAFGPAPASWNNEAVLERYELLYALGAVAEARSEALAGSGEPMGSDHRRILATAIARIRGKIKYRPIVFELLPPTFTLSDLQGTVEALAGQRFHTPNFRRLVEETGVVERTGQRRRTMGRPAETYRFRPDVVSERPDPGIAIRASKPSASSQF